MRGCRRTRWCSELASNEAAHPRCINHTKRRSPGFMIQLQRPPPAGQSQTCGTWPCDAGCSLARQSTQEPSLRGAMATTVEAPVHETGSGAASRALVLSALGVVFGDIGTSPLYALKEASHAASHGGVSPGSVLGVLSLILWALIVVISIKYCIFILRADNRGEGGIIALLALLGVRRVQAGSWRMYLTVMGLVGTALLYADGTITPAISVLSAVEGLTVDAPGFGPYVVPITVAILA